VVGWAFGALVSLLGILASALLDLPTGATVACMFGLTLLIWSGLARLLRRRTAVMEASP
jgi:ABC-type Mn2+/Zn2+ transport system permease subunit